MLLCDRIQSLFRPVRWRTGCVHRHAVRKHRRFRKTLIRRRRGHGLKNLFRKLEHFPKVVPDIQQNIKVQDVDIEAEVRPHVVNGRAPKHPHTLKGLDRIPDVALGRFRDEDKGFPLVGDALLFAHMHQPVRDLFRGHPPNDKRWGTPAENGRPHPFGLGRTEDAHEHLVL